MGSTVLWSSIQQPLRRTVKTQSGTPLLASRLASSFAPWRKSRCEIGCYSPPPAYSDQMFWQWMLDPKSKWRKCKFQLCVKVLQFTRLRFCLVSFVIITEKCSSQQSESIKNALSFCLHGSPWRIRKCDGCLVTVCLGNCREQSENCSHVTFISELSLFLAEQTCWSRHRPIQTVRHCNVLRLLRLKCCDLT